jgi:hypothetical protein
LLGLTTPESMMSHSIFQGNEICGIGIPGRESESDRGIWWDWLGFWCDSHGIPKCFVVLSIFPQEVRVLTLTLFSVPCRMRPFEYGTRPLCSEFTSDVLLRF